MQQWSDPPCAPIQPTWLHSDAAALQSSLPSSAQKKLYLIPGTPGALECMENPCPLGGTHPILWLQTQHEVKSRNNTGSDPF